MTAAWTVFALMVVGLIGFLVLLARAGRSLSQDEIDWDAVEADVESVLAGSDLDGELAELIEREGGRS